MPQPAAAQEEDARLLFEQGREAYSAGRYGDARDAWVSAHEASGRADLLYNIAQAYRGLGLPVQELDYLQRFVAAVPVTHPSRAPAQTRVEALEARIADTFIVLTEVPANADVLLDGAPMEQQGATRSLSVMPGPHQVVVVRDGFLPFHATVDAVAGRATSVTVRMEERPVARAHQADGITRGLWVSGGGLLAAGAVSGGVAFGQADGTLETSRRADRLRRVGYAADGMMAAGGGGKGGGEQKRGEKKREKGGKRKKKKKNGIVLGVVGLIRYMRSEGDAPSEAPAAQVGFGVGRDGVAFTVEGAF
ncbi:MAG: PEGA domain-containing protein [Sandaracinaceae bacterium]|nr:PEGA domain-containing protein [Sandaracinaceae bacterium]